MNKMSVAHYFSFYLHRSGKSHKDVALAIGLKNSNMVSMLKKGRMKIPLGRIGQLADCLDMPKQDFFLRCVAEYDEPLFRTLYNCVPGAFLTDQEIKNRKDVQRILDDLNRREAASKLKRLQKAAKKKGAVRTMNMDAEDAKE